MLNLLKVIPPSIFSLFAPLSLSSDAPLLPPAACLLQPPLSHLSSRSRISSHHLLPSAIHPAAILVLPVIPIPSQSAPPIGPPLPPVLRVTLPIPSTGHPLTPARPPLPSPSPPTDPPFPPRLRLLPTPPPRSTTSSAPGVRHRAPNLFAR